MRSAQNNRSTWLAGLRVAAMVKRFSDGRGPLGSTGADPGFQPWRVGTPPRTMGWVQKGGNRMKWLFKVLGVLVGLYLMAAVAVFLFSRMARGGSRDRIRKFNRDTLNPWMLQRAGGQHWYASVVKHLGRHSGSEYETPVVMHQIDGRLAIPLPYGSEVDWMLNLRHHNAGTAVHKGEDFAVSDPVIVTRAAISEGLGFRDTLRYRMFGVDEFVTLRAEAVADGPPTVEGARPRDEVLV